MDQFSSAELAELFFNRESVIDTQFQYWITITFAVIVANFVAGKRLSLRSRYVISLLYVLAVAVLVSRWSYVADDALKFRQQLEQMGVVLNFPVFTVISRLALVACGTAATLTFLLSNWLRDAPSE